MSSKLPAIITTFASANVANQFGKAHAPGLQPDLPQTTWRGRYDLQIPHVARRRLVNGYKSSGDSEVFRVLAWENPSRPGAFSVGMLMESFAYGQQLSGVPQSAQLWLHGTHATYEEAMKASESLALNNVFSGLKKLIQEGGEKYPRLSADVDDMPFAKPTHWKTAKGAIASLSNP